MVVANGSPLSAVAGLTRPTSNPLGFAKRYNFILWLILGGSLLGFTLPRLKLINIDGVFCGPGPSSAIPGECYYYRKGIEHAGIFLHLGGILPAGVLAVFQFVPAIRRKAPMVHRISGYIIYTLSGIGVVGVLMIARRALGGGLVVQTMTGLSSIIFVSCSAIAFYNIKKLQIDQHRAWMLRAWVIASFIITMRLIGIIMAYIIGRPGSDYFVVRPCYVVDDMFRGVRATVEALYPACEAYYSGADANVHVAIRADMTSRRPDQAAAAVHSSLGAGGFLALALHAIGAELYLHLTPAEGERLRRVSYHRQRAAGMKNPGNAGLTVQRLGDAEPWLPRPPRHQSQQPNGAIKEASLERK